MLPSAMHAWEIAERLIARLERIIELLEQLADRQEHDRARHD